MDMLRIDDLSQMRQMQKELTKMRKAKDKKKGSSKNKAAASDRPMSGMPAPQSSGIGSIATNGSVAISNISQLTGGVLSSTNNNNPNTNQIRNRI